MPQACVQTVLERVPGITPRTLPCFFPPHCKGSSGSIGVGGQPAPEEGQAGHQLPGQRGAESGRTNCRAADTAGGDFCSDTRCVRGLGGTAS